MDWMNKNFWFTELSAVGSWLSLAYIEGVIGLITGIAAAVAAVVFAIKGVYELKEAKLEYRKMKKDFDEDK
jgi:hypothetical protein